MRVGVGRPDSTDPEIVSAYVLGRFGEPTPRSRAGRARRRRARAAVVSDAQTSRAARRPGGRSACSAAPHIRTARGLEVAALAEAARASRSARSCRPACARTCSRRCSTRARAARAGGRRRRPRRARPGRRPEGLPRPAAGALLPGPRRALRVAPRAAAAPRRPAHRRPRRAARRRRAPRWSSPPPSALAEKVPDPELRPHGFTIEKGGLLDLDETADQLVACGYERVDQVEERGQFAIRGDILDVYPATEERAVRCELFDVEVERLTWFSTFTQRSLEEAERVEIAPAAELGPEHRELAEMARRDRGRRAPRHRRGAAGGPLPRAARAGARATRSWRSPPRRSSPPALRRLLGGRDARASTTQDAHHLYVAPGAARRGARRSAPRSRLSSISARPAARVPRPGRRHRRALAAGGRARAREAGALRLPHGRRLGAPRRGRARRSYNLARVQRRLPRRQARRPPSRPSLFAAAGLREGFLAPAPEARDPARAPAAAPPPAAPEPRRAGRGRDRLVHRPARRRRRSCTRTTASRASPASRRRPSAASRATTSSSSTATATASSCRATSCTRSAATWAPTPATRRSRSSAASSGSSMKLRARRAAEALAGELINLYAERKRRAGHAFPHDREWQLEFEGALPLPRDARPARGDRGRCSADMEEARPMDRLICGDVGYGKTEVALRAAFKAAEDGKQVMFLVPTTVLAQQHFGTFTERLRDYPFTIEMVSRFRSPKEARDALDGFARGQGRHPDRHPPAALARRAPEGPRAADRRRGAALRREAEGAAAPAASCKVDVLSLSATPIPRTLQMSLAGLRDISVIETPPEGRRPVQHLRRRVRRGARERGDRARAGARGPGLLPAQPRGDDRRDRRARPRAGARGARVGGARPDGRGAARAGDARLPARRAPTCWSAPRSSSPGSTSRAPTR